MVTTRVTLATSLNFIQAIALSPPVARATVWAEPVKVATCPAANAAAVWVVDSINEAGTAKAEPASVRAAARPTAVKAIPRPANRWRSRSRACARRPLTVPDGQAQLVGCFLVGFPLQVTEHDRQTVFVRKPIQLGVQRGAQLLGAVVTNGLRHVQVLEWLPRLPRLLGAGTHAPCDRRRCTTSRPRACSDPTSLLCARIRNVA